MRLGAKVLATAALLGLLGTAGGAGTLSALNDTTANPGNTFVSGTVEIADNDAGTALASFSNGRPGTTSTGCVNVTYSGTLPANVSLYATTTGTLGPYLDLKITRGKFTGTPAAGSCTNFTADTTDYGNGGAGIVYNGLLSSLGSTAATGVVDPRASAPTTWAAGDVHAYKVEVTLRNDPLGQGKTATTSFSWVAENT